ncbi:TPA: transcriptional regulator [Pseudomonas aeruginosa]|uniref:transcriptional regulator n=1 Tax=Pseudomonas aeruginosa TaxID=287 RepID=UPI000D397113|nr:transcriptional regulator [Pseudomonas aeruginosa]PTZ12150.1 transcriptional regulator [Pseudomonas aeruginosa]HBP6159311.1 transcriptional regulator [Pseudomonas aeruginosa]HBP6356257.1 transcriptional regulator [Pseudomonas aeruginosa]HBP6516918.1 transcriptional regulator [Pseudomonas aeruginosa]HBP6598124.1 transcriptional regulator [Pseudomonas aeruginosa]
MSIERADIAIRLVEERGRTGYSRVAFARELGVSSETLRLYEIGQSALNAEVLAKAASLGVDVQYVLTGVYSLNLSKAEQAASPQPLAPKYQVQSGTMNVTENGNVIHTTRHTTTVKAEVKPGEQHISEAQAAKLTELVREVVELEGRLRKSPKGYRAVWGALNAHCDVTRYLLIAAADYEKAEKYLRQWIGRLNSMDSAPVADNDAWRKRRYSYIKINTKGDSDWLTAYLKKTFKAVSLTDLSDDQLDRTYRAVATRKRKPHSSKGV